MNRYQEIYEESNNIDENLRPKEKYDYHPEYHLFKRFYPYENDFIGYERARYIKINSPPKNNAYKRRDHNYISYTKTNFPLSGNNQKMHNKKLKTPERIKNTYNYFNKYYNLGDQLTNPLNNDIVKIRHNIYNVSYFQNIHCTYNCIIVNQNKEYIVI